MVHRRRLLALLTLKRLLDALEPGLLDDHLRPLQTRIEQLLASRHLGAGEASARIRVLAMAARRKNPRHFQIVAGAVLQRHRLKIDYYSQHGGNTIRIYSVLFEGRFTVTDPTRFRTALETGIGHGKVMGLDLLSVVPTSG
ncbi:MAG: type I-E CRISPR-associated protein Cas6/Cse3/CasE [Thiobacillus sp.]